MSKERSNLLPDDAPKSTFDTAIEWLIVALVAFCPFAYGGAEPRGELVVLSIVAAISLLLSLRIALRRAGGFVWSWVGLPVGLFLLLAALQLLPLPVGVVKVISPAAVAIRAELQHGADPPRAPITLTLYPWATVHGLRLLLAVAAIFISVVTVYRRPAQIKRLLVAVSLVGAAVATVAVYQVVTADTTLYGIFGTLPSGHPNSGPFMNHSHFGQFMNLSIGAALALVLVQLEQLRAGHGRHQGSFERRGQSTWPLWPLGTFIVIAAATICLSLTRGGMLSLLISGAVTGLLLAIQSSRGRGSGGRGTLIFALGILVLCALMYFGFDTVYSRLATLTKAQSDTGTRWEIVRDLSVAWRRFPLVGTGLGSHEVVFPMFDRSVRSGIATHAENEYAQLTEETGFLGLALCTAFLLIIAANYLRLTLRPGSPIRAAAFGLGFGLIAVLFHSLSDFGQHVPANAILTAIFCGLLVAIGKRASSQTKSTSDQPAGLRAPLLLWVPVRLLPVLALAAGAVWCVYCADVARRARDAWQHASDLEKVLAASGWQDGSNDDYATLIRNASTATTLQPTNITYQYSLAAYRWRAISRVTDPQTGGLVMTPQSIDFASRIVNDLKASFPLCPTYGQTYALAGQIEWFVLAQPQGIEHIHQGYRLAAYDPAVCFAAGTLDADQGNWDAAAAELKRAAELDGNLKSQVIDLYVKRFNRPDLAHTMAAGDRDALSNLASDLDAAGQPDAAARCRADAAMLLRQAADRPGASSSDLESLAELFDSQSDFEHAIDYYRRALERDYGQVDWRMRLARLLGKVGRTKEAMYEAKICRRLRPQDDDAAKLMADLSLQGVSEN